MKAFICTGKTQNFVSLIIQFSWGGTHTIVNTAPDYLNTLLQILYISKPYFFLNLEKVPQVEP